MISNKCQYALRAVLELAKQEGRGPISIAAIAREQDIPARFLEAIMRQLKQAGYVEAQRGKEGGYLLAKPAREILVSDLIEEVQGPLFAPYDDHAQTRRSVDVFAPVWEAARSALAESMAHYTFDVLARHELKARGQLVANYTI